MSSINDVSKIFLFHAMTEKELQQIASFCTYKNAAKGVLLFSEGEKASYFYYILQGKVKIYKQSPAGMEYTIEIHSEGDLVAEAAIFDKETYPANCSTLEDTFLISIPKDNFKQLIFDNPELAIKVMHGYSLRLRKLVDAVEQLSLYDIKIRLAIFLLKNAAFDGKNTICQLNSSKKELASALGTIPETLSRALKYLKDNELITEEDNHVFILDKKKLLKYIESHSN